MTQEREATVDDTPRKRRKRGPNKPKATNLALEEIDRRLAEALTEKSAAMANVSKLLYWQDRLQRITQEIESLIGYQQRLTGQTSSIIPPPISVGSTTTGIPFVVGAPVPPGVTSAPVRQPAPSGTNLADTIGSEGGFA